LIEHFFGFGREVRSPSGFLGIPAKVLNLGSKGNVPFQIECLIDETRVSFIPAKEELLLLCQDGTGIWLRVRSEESGMDTAVSTSG
jgi:hypothetical protein